MNLENLPSLTKLDKLVVAAIGETPFDLLLNHNDCPPTPSNEAVSRITKAIGKDSDNWYDTTDVYYSLKAIGMKIRDRAHRQSAQPIGQLQAQTA